MSERQEGWYHIKTRRGWECARWSRNSWKIAESAYHFRDIDFEEIGNRIPSPDEPWVTVPVEATNEMAVQGLAARYDESSTFEVYRCMISVAPKA